MATPYSVLIDRFFRLIEEDRDYFDYYDLYTEESLRLATDRAMALLEEAIDRIIMEGQPSVDFTDTDDASQCFNFDLTPQEKILIPSLMYEAYLARDISYLKTKSVDFTPTDMRIMDPSNARKTFMTMYNAVCERNDLLLATYRDSDRLTGSYLGVDYSAYDDTVS